MTRVAVKINALDKIKYLFMLDSDNAKDCARALFYLKLLLDSQPSLSNFLTFQIEMSLRISAKRGAAALNVGNISAFSNCPLKRNASQARSATTNLPEGIRNEIYVRRNPPRSRFEINQLADKVSYREMHSYQTQIRPRIL
jgi:hypothetical protein